MCQAPAAYVKYNNAGSAPHPPPTPSFPNFLACCAWTSLPGLPKVGPPGDRGGRASDPPPHGATTLMQPRWRCPRGCSPFGFSLVARPPWAPLRGTRAPRVCTRFFSHKLPSAVIDKKPCVPAPTVLGLSCPVPYTLACVLMHLRACTSTTCMRGHTVSHYRLPARPPQVGLYGCGACIEFYNHTVCGRPRSGVHPSPRRAGGPPRRPSLRSLSEVNPAHIARHAAGQGGRSTPPHTFPCLRIHTGCANM